MIDWPDAILIPVAGHLLLVLFLFLMVSWKRMSAVRHGAMRINDLAYKGDEPEASRRWVNNLQNQFEVPIFFYAIIALIFATDTSNWLYEILAWIFFGGRLLHTAVQTMSDIVLLRGMVFTINFFAVIAMWLHFFLSRWF